MNAMRRIVLGVALGVVGAAAGGCGLFDTRDPEEPPPPVAGCRPLTGGPIAAVIPNIEDFYGRGSSATCYISMLDTTFAFHPDVQDSTQATVGRYDGWDEVVEETVNSAIGSRQDFMEVDFIQEYATAIISTDQRTQVRFLEYQLRVSYTPLPPALPDTVRYSGLADITFRQGDDGQWKIGDWVDRRGSTGDPTWGILRGDNRP